MTDQDWKAEATREITALRHRAEAAEEENKRLLRLLNTAVSRGCDHCNESVAKVRAALSNSPAPPLEYDDEQDPAMRIRQEK